MAAAWRLMMRYEWCEWVSCCIYHHLISLSIPVNGPKIRSEQEDDSAEDWLDFALAAYSSPGKMNELSRTQTRLLPRAPSTGKSYADESKIFSEYLLFMKWIVVLRQKTETFLRWEQNNKSFIARFLKFSNAKFWQVMANFRIPCGWKYLKREWICLYESWIHKFSIRLPPPR